MSKQQICDMSQRQYYQYLEAQVVSLKVKLEAAEGSRKQWHIEYGKAESKIITLKKRLEAAETTIKDISEQPRFDNETGGMNDKIKAIEERHNRDKLFVHLEANIIRKAHTDRGILLDRLDVAELELSGKTAELELANVNITEWKHCAKVNENLKLKAEATIKEISELRPIAINTDEDTPDNMIPINEVVMYAELKAILNRSMS